MKKNKTLCRTISTFMNKGRLLLLFVLFLGTISSYAQINNIGQNPILNNLYQEPSSSVYIINGEAKVYGETPIKLYCDIASVNKLFEVNSQYTNVKLIVLKVREGETIPYIYISNLQSFADLKFFYVEFESDVCGSQSDTCLYDIVHNAIINTSNTVGVWYKLAIPQ